MLQQFYEVVNTFFFNPDPAAKDQAEAWLTQFQSSPQAWAVADAILTQNVSTEANIFAAMTMRAKARRNGEGGGRKKERKKEKGRAKKKQRSFSRCFFSFLLTICSLQVQRSFHELQPETHVTLRDVLLRHLGVFSSGFQTVATLVSTDTPSRRDMF